MKLKDINIDISKINQVINEINKHENDNPACHLINYWKERMSPTMIKELKQSGGKLQYGFIGDGWPNKSDQSRAIEIDSLHGYNIKNAFDEEDLNCRDIGDTIYQTNLLLQKFRKLNPDHEGTLRVLDIGSGYGRLAIGFLHAINNIQYFGLDYSPIGLLNAGDVVKQMTGKKTLPWSSKSKKFNTYKFISLPAWRIKDIQNLKFDIFISVHSMQEMTMETNNYYIDLINELAAKNSIFYSVNLSPADNICGADWKLIYKKGYPINRDGNYNQKIWKIK